eukprot:5535562-Pyramimonas_sp.AAC.1
MPETVSSSDLRGNLLTDVDPQGQQRLPLQLHFKAPVPPLQRILCHVAALRQVGRTGPDGRPRWKDQQGMLPQRGAALRSHWQPHRRHQE